MMWMMAQYGLTGMCGAYMGMMTPMVMVGDAAVVTTRKIVFNVIMTLMFVTWREAIQGCNPFQERAKRNTGPSGSNVTLLQCDFVTMCLRQSVPTLQNTLGIPSLHVRVPLGVSFPSRHQGTSLVGRNRMRGWAPQGV